MALYTINNRRLSAVLHTSKGGTFTTGVLTLLVVVSMMLFAIIPAYNSITGKLTNNDLKQQYIDTLNAKKTTMDLLSKEYSTNNDAISEFEAITLSRGNNELLVANFERLAQDVAVTMKSVDFTSDGSAVVSRESLIGYSQLGVQPFTFSFTGKLDDLKTLVSSIEGFPVPVELTTINYNFGEDTTAGSAFTGTLTDDPDFTLNLTGVYYFWNTASL